MAHDVFISYASEDKITADAVCAGLEKAGIRCWIAPRDILTSENYDDAIIRAINSSKIMVVIFSSSIFQSQFVKSEVERAFSKGLIIAPFRIEDIEPKEGLELYLGRRHWLDAMTPPLENHIQTLVINIGPMLAARTEPQEKPAPTAPTTTAPTISQASAQKSRRPTGIYIALAAAGGFIAILCLLALVIFLGKNYLDNLRRPAAALPATPALSRTLESVSATSVPTTPVENPAGGAQPPTPAAVDPAPPRGNWLYLGDLPRSINAFAFDPAHPETIFAASGDYTGAGGGVYKSQDGGLSWQSSSSGLPNKTVQALAFIPGTAPVLLAAVGSDIYTSTDNAASWNKTSTTGTGGGNDASMFAASPDGKTIFAVIKAVGITRSDDCGQNWMPLSEGLPRDDYNPLTVSVAVDPANPHIVYAGTGGFVGGGQGVFKSTDGGETWAAANQGMLDFRITALAVDPRQPDVIYAGSDNGNLFKSSDGAQTWTNLTDNIKSQQTSPREMRNILIDPVSSVVYLLADNAGVIYSGDGGEKWRNLGLPPGANQPQFTTMTIVFGDSPTVFTAVPGVIGDLIGGWRYAAGQAAPAATPTLVPDASGSGKTVPLTGGWKAASGLPRKINMLAASPDDPNLVFASAGDYSTPGGIYKSEDGGLTWMDSSQGLPDKAAGPMAFTAGNPAGLLVAIGSDIYTSADSAATWSKAGSVGSGGGVEVKAFATSADRKITFAALSYAGIVRSDDGGQNWIPLAGEGLPADTSTQALLVQTLAVDPTNPRVLYAGTGGFVGQGQGVYKSTDGGDTWAPSNRGMLDYKIISLAIDPLKSQEIYAGSEIKDLFKSSDDGQTWVNLTERLNLPPSAGNAMLSISIDSVTGTVYVLTAYSGVVYSGDGGVKWRMLGVPGSLTQPRFSEMAVIFGEKPVILVSVEDTDQPVYRFAAK